MAVDNFIKQIWSEGILQAKDKAHVAASVANRSYEGEITAGGNKVKINQIGAIDVSTYTKNSTSLTIQELQSSQMWLDIDQMKYFAFGLDDVDKVQGNNGIFEEATRKAGYALSDTSDSYTLGLYAQAGIIQNTDGSPANINSANIEDEVLSFGQAFDEANLQREGRFMIVPPWFINKLAIAGITNRTDNTAVYNNGFVMHALGFDFLMSNNVSMGTASTGAQTRIIGGVRGESILYAEQLIEVEAYRPESSFEDALKGLHIYGAKIVPDRTGVLYADLTAEA